jgi:hypothetical protein
MGYILRGGFGLPFRKSFTFRSSNINVNLHIFEKDDPEIELNLLFRNFLRENKETRMEYTKLKYLLAKKEKLCIENKSMYREYTLGKNDFIQRVLKKTKFDRFRFVLCSHDNEWAAVRKFRARYYQNFTDKNLCMSALDHSHFLLYKGFDVVGYVYMLKDESVPKIIMVDGGKSVEDVLLSYVEKYNKMLRSYR